MSDLTGEIEKGWRRENARHLKDVGLRFQRYSRRSESWDHDHCAACGVKFAEIDGPDVQHEGYATCEDYPKGAHYEWVLRPLVVETLAQQTLSMASTSPSHLGDKTAAMVAEVRAALADVHEEVVETSALVAWRPDFR